MTRAQRAVLAVLETEPAFLSAQAVHARLRDGGEQVGLTSVYRALQALATGGAVDAVRTPDGEVTYRLCATERHHHHLTCRNCGATVEVEAPNVERWIGSVAEANGYRPDRHTVEITGTCARCLRRERRRETPPPSRGRR